MQRKVTEFVTNKFVFDGVQVVFLNKADATECGTKKERIIFNFYRCTVHSDIHTVHSPTDAHLLNL
jgi:hypothetical protein